MNCPNCGAEIVEHAHTCGSCGYDLTRTLRGRPGRKRYTLVVLAAVVVLAAGLVAWGAYPRSRSEPRRAAAGPPVSDEGQASGPADSAVLPAATGPADGSVPDPGSDKVEFMSLADQVWPPGGYALPASYGALGPQLLEAGAIDYDRFARLYLQNGAALTNLQVAILKDGSDSQVVIDADNSYFLLNFFWAVGLVNQNPLLDEGQMKRYGEEGVGRFASTGGWTLGTKPATELYSSAPLISLTREQQARVEEVAGAIYRPCCGNPTSFPDCNHGMAMLGLLQLMASQGAGVDEMFEAAKYVNGFWFPQQTLEVALYFQAAEGTDFPSLDARRAFGAEFFSGSGFSQVHQWLAQNDLLEQVPEQGGSCGV